MSVKGSSPLTRGKHDHGRDDVHALGLIPAHAGKTTTLLGTLAASRAHPRSRGENYSSLLSTCRRLGSSPLTRGKRQQDVAVQDLHGLIPAHAGKTCCP